MKEQHNNKLDSLEYLAKLSQGIGKNQLTLEKQFSESISQVEDPTKKAELERLYKLVKSGKTNPIEVMKQIKRWL